MVNGYGYEQYKRIRVKKFYRKKVEPLPDTYVILKKIKFLSFVTLLKM